jgi:SAM-dependent methyltransferase
VLCAQTLKHLPGLGDVMKEFARVLRTDGRLVFSVTHPNMDFTGYELNVSPSFILSREADIHHHSEQDYRDGLTAAGFEVEEWRAILVSDAIAHLLTPESLQKVHGRPQVLAVSAIRCARVPLPGPR